MKKIFEIPELEVVRFVEADIVVCSDCHKEWQCSSYDLGGKDCDLYTTDNPLEDCTSSNGIMVLVSKYSCVIDNDYTDDPYHSHYTG